MESVECKFPKLIYTDVDIQKLRYFQLYLLSIFKLLILLTIMEINREKGTELNGTIVQQHMKECDTTEGPLVIYLKRSNSVFLKATEKCEGNTFHEEVIPFLLNNIFFSKYSRKNNTAIYAPMDSPNPIYNKSLLQQFREIV